MNAHTNALMPVNDPAADFLLDATTKGMPATAQAPRMGEIGAQGWNVLAGDCPLPLAVIRHCSRGSSPTVPAGCTITTLNDQHAHMALPPAATLAVGNMVAFGIAHPCTTFERWQILMLVDAKLDIVGAVRTFF